MSAGSHRLSVPPVPPVEASPGLVWSVMVPTFNCARLASETLASVVSQAPPADRMEIVVVDDASSDDIAGVVARYGGRVRLHRQPKNLGVPGNLTAAIGLARGRLVHLLHGDDLVEPVFYETMEAALADAEVGAAFCQSVFIDQDGRELGLSPMLLPVTGRLPDALRLLASEQRIMTPSICVKRKVYERLGGFHPALNCAEDWEMWVRIARHYPIVHVAQPLARYRMQPDSNTGRNTATARDAEFNGKAIDIIRTHLPLDIADEVTAQARRTYALSALVTAKTFMLRGDGAAAVAQLRAALRLGRHAMTRTAVARASRRILLAALRRNSRA